MAVDGQSSRGGLMVQLISPEIGKIISKVCICLNSYSVCVGPESSDML